MADFERSPLPVEDLQRELIEYERVYATPSADLCDAFRNSALVETPDFFRWDFIYGVLERVGALPQ